ncbi:MAG: hypothetical protein IJ562_09230 [Prevotella sp.]|nr:hypothetical protein [Prevotella sp.]
MNIEILTLADSVQQYDGKLVIVGTFNDISAPKLPHVVPEMVVACKVEFLKDEAGKHILELCIVNGQTKEPIIAPIKTETPSLDIKGDFLYLNFVTNINNTLFKDAGLYDVVMKVDDVEKVTHLRINAQ